MKHFIGFLIFIFTGLFVALYFRNSRDASKDTRPVLKVYASASFIKDWGPGPWLKEKFENSCDCRVEYHDSSDSVLLMQRLKSEAHGHGADVVLGFDQYDLEMAQKGFDWKPLRVEGLDFEDAVRVTLTRSNLVPYDWGVLAFLVRRSAVKLVPRSFEDLLSPELQGAISIPDPRTSSPGMQFLIWLIQAKGEEAAFQYLQKLNKQVKAYGANWSTTYGLFQKGQVKATLSWVTSTIFHQVEEKSKDIVAAEFSEGHPIQFEYLGIPMTCQNCDLAKKFVDLVLSKEGQKIIMEKNYMFPVIRSVREGTPFDSVLMYKLIDMSVLPTMVERERLLRKWSTLRRAE